MDTFVVTSGSTNHLGFPIGSTTKFNKLLFITPFSGIGCANQDDMLYLKGRLYRKGMIKR